MFDKSNENKSPDYKVNVDLGLPKNDIKVSCTQGDKEVGNMEVCCRPDKQDCEVKIVYVDKNYRHQGKANAMYKVSLDYLSKSQFKDYNISGCRMPNILIKPDDILATPDGVHLLEKFIHPLNQAGCARTSITEARSKFADAPQYTEKTKIFGQYVAKSYKIERDIGCQF